MTTILAAMQNSLLVLDSIKEGWKIHEHLKHHSPNSVALDPDNPSTAYCGTFDAGLWRTIDGGQRWDKTSLNVSKSYITSISVSPIEKGESGLSYMLALSRV